jgi:SAM-dependent methyltransferase
VDSPNAQQIEYWNGPGGERWVSAHDRLDRSLAAIGEAVLAFAAPARGETVLDVGCGCGTTTWELHRRTAARTTGLDISRPMLEYARAKGPADAQVTFREGDASSAPLDASDLVFSRFGVMFFADPVAAFRHLRTALAPGGRLRFVCWRALEQNPWAHAPLVAARPLLPPQPPFDPHSPGPFAFADGERLRGILDAAGWRDIEVRPLDSSMYLGATLDEAAGEPLTVGPLARLAAELDDRVRDAIRVRVAEAFAKYVTPAGVAPPAAAWLVGAR